MTDALFVAAVVAALYTVAGLVELCLPDRYRYDRPCPAFRWDCHDDPYSAPSDPRPACTCGDCPEVSPGRQLRAGERP